MTKRPRHSKPGNAPLNPLSRRGERKNSRRGFTLIELLVAISIMLVLSALTFTMVNVTMDTDRIASGSREVQSFLEGARNQAIYAKAPRGVRFLLSPDDPTVVASMIFIGAPSKREGTVGLVIGSMDIASPTVQNEWDALNQRGILNDGARIKLPYDRNNPATGEWYTISYDTGATDWKLTENYAGALPGATAYQLELAPAVLPNQEPRLLPRNVVIDLDNSILPQSWGTAAAYSTQIDVLFSPKGAVMGAVGATGRVHFVLSDVADANFNITEPALDPRQRLYPPWLLNTAYVAGQWIVPKPDLYLAYRCVTGGTTNNISMPAEFDTATPGQQVTDGSVVWQCFAKKRNLIVSLATQTGNAASYPADVNLRPGDTVVDPFFYAETGEVAK